VHVIVVMTTVVRATVVNFEVKLLFRRQAILFTNILVNPIRTNVQAPDDNIFNNFFYDVIIVELSQTVSVQVWVLGLHFLVS
jgi:hypothetical protein